MVWKSRKIELFFFNTEGFLFIYTTEVCGGLFFAPIFLQALCQSAFVLANLLHL